MVKIRAIAMKILRNSNGTVNTMHQDNKSTRTQKETMIISFFRSFDISFFLSSCRSITSKTCHKNPYRSLQIFGIQDYGKWSVINKAHLHISSEHSGFSLKSGIPALIDNMLI